MTDQPRQTTQIAVLLLSLSLLPATVFANEDVPPMSTDRPTVFYTPQNVAKGYFQFEGGFAYNFDRVISRRIEVEVATADLFHGVGRFGLTSTVELRLGAGYTAARVTAGGFVADAEGIEVVTAGTKIHLWSEHGSRPKAALVLTLAVPVESREEKVLPEAVVAASNQVSDALVVGYSFGASQDGSFNINFLYALVATGNLMKSLSVFTELFGIFSEAYKPSTSLDGGLIWLPRRNLQFDAAIGNSFVEGDSWFAVAGVSFRLPR